MKLQKIITIIFLFCFTQGYAKSVIPQWTLNNMMQVETVDDVAISPDGNYVAYTVSQNINDGAELVGDRQIYITNTKNFHTLQFTFISHDNFAPQWTADSKNIAFLSNRNGVVNVWLKALNGFNPKQITNSITDIAQFSIAPTQNFLAYINETPPIKNKILQPIRVGELHSCNNLWLQKLDGMQAIQLTAYQPQNNCDAIYNLAWSPDGNSIAFSHAPMSLHDIWYHGSLSLINIRDKKIKNLLAQDKKLFALEPKFSTDGKKIAFRTDSHVYILNLATNTINKLANTPDELIKLLIGWSADDRKVFVLENYHTVSHIIALSIDGKKINIMPPNDQLIMVPALSNNGKYMAFSMQNSNVSPDVYVAGIQNWQPQKLTHLNLEVLNIPLGKTKLITWRAADGLKIEGLLTYPVNYASGKKYPLLVEIHGGPGDLFQQRYIARPSVFPINVFSAKGFFYLRPNIRGSSGYGTAFRKLNHRDWGGKDYHDILSGIKYLMNKNLVDPQRIGILGWSYGGYMAAWTITQSRMFKIAIIGGGITDLISYAGTNDLPDFVPDSFGGTYWQDQNIYVQRSPIFSVMNAHTATLLEYGMNDVRVPPTQGFEFYHALKHLHVPVQFLLFPDSAHAITIPQLKWDAAKANVAWVEKYLN